jgi:hypothetical protein
LYRGGKGKTRLEDVEGIFIEGRTCEKGVGC